VVLLGHSMGGMVVRSAYLNGLERGMPWAAAVSRIVLFASPNRGFSRERLSPLERAAMLLLGVPLRLSLIDLRAGSPFVTDLRIRWIRAFARMEAEGRAPYVVQLLGDRDSLVAHEDSLDVEQMRSSAHLTVPDATHGSIVDVRGDAGAARWPRIRAAVLGDPLPTAPPQPLSPEEAARPVVFLVHGIRAGTDDWVRAAKERLEARPEKPVVRQPSYGYYSLWSFAFGLARTRNLREVLDDYGQELARRPGADFHYVGHSNGTFVLGQALRMVPAIRFRNVFLAGSVLPGSYDWDDHVEQGRVVRLRNVRAAKDLPVALCCPILRGAFVRRVGTGGFSGFTDDVSGKEEVSYVPGGHGEALAPARLDAVAEFALTGSAAPVPGLVARPRTWLAWASRAASYWLVLAGAWTAAAVVARGTSRDVLAYAAAGLVTLVVAAKTA
jgi:alpha-beta hydrolase superfamily lysophospholipase